VEIGTNKIYAAVHQFGIGAYSHVASKRGHPAIPARPFLVVQDKDWDEIKAELAEYVTGGRA
jgi:phage gpG-like protein